MRGPDMGGGVGGLLYSVRNHVYPGQGFAWWPNSFPNNPEIPQSLTYRYNLSNGRGDVVAQSDSSGALTWTASYEAYGKRTVETGENKDKQRANSKDEDPTGLLNEGFRYRDIETGVWLSRDPAGFVDGPNLYAYVKQNPWSAFDPKGLSGERVDDDGFKWSNRDHHKVPAQVARDAGWGKEAKSVFDNAKIKTPNGHNFTSHRAYNAEVSAEMAEFFAEKGVVKNGVSQIGGMSAKEQSALAQEFVDRLDNTSNKFIKGFNAAVPDGPGGVASWFAKEGKDVVLKSTGKVAMTKGARVVNGIAKTANIGGRLAKGVPLLGGLLVGFSSAAEGKDNNQIAKDVVMSSTGADIAQWAIEENSVVKGATTIIKNRNNQLDNIAETLSSVLKPWIG